MKTTYELLVNIVYNFIKTDQTGDWYTVLEEIDKVLDDELGPENRRPIKEEYLSNELYNDILECFKEGVDLDD